MTTNQERKWPAGTVDKMNEWAESQLGISLEPWQLDIMRQFEAPKPRTLADMTRDEREACQWMQADFDHGFADPPTRVVITMIHPNVANIILPNGVINCAVHSNLTPLPDLPRLTWPEEQTTEENPDPPEPEDAPDGYYLVHWWGEENPVPAEKVQGQWWVIGKETFLHPKDVLIVSRLVMEGWV